MFIYKAISAVAAVAFGAALMLALPGFSPEVAASTPAPVVKGDRLDVRPALTDCTQRAWPYYDNSCLRHGSRGEPRPIRMVSTDRIAR